MSMFEFLNTIPSFWQGVLASMVAAGFCGLIVQLVKRLWRSGSAAYYLRRRPLIWKAVASDDPEMAALARRYFQHEIRVAFAAVGVFFLMGEFSLYLDVPRAYNACIVALAFFGLNGLITMFRLAVADQDLIEKRIAPKEPDGAENAK